MGTRDSWWGIRRRMCCLYGRLSRGNLCDRLIQGDLHDRLLQGGLHDRLLQHNLCCEFGRLLRLRSGVRRGQRTTSYWSSGRGRGSRSFTICAANPQVRLTGDAGVVARPWRSGCWLEPWCSGHCCGEGTLIENDLFILVKSQRSACRRWKTLVLRKWAFWQSKVPRPQLE